MKKIALVTGSRRGIGLGIARALGHAGWFVVVSAPAPPPHQLVAPYGIPVFEVRPGIIRTDMTAGVTEKYEKLIAGGITPIKRFGTPEDVANCVLAAAGGLLDFATGQVLNADGGFHIRRL